MLKPLNMHLLHSDLNRCDGGSVGLQDTDGCTGPQAPHSDGFVTTGWSDESVLIVDSHVTDFCWVAAERGQKAAVIRGPDFHQAVIRTLQAFGKIQNLANSYPTTVAIVFTHRKYPSTGAVKDYTVHRGEVAKNAFMYLHVLVGRWWQNLAKAGRACSSPSSHGGHFTWGHEDN